MTYVFWDIETERLDEPVLSKFRPEFEAPGTYKDPAKIEAFTPATRSSKGTR